MKTPTKYRAELLPLKPNTGYVQVCIKDNGDLTKEYGGFEHIMDIRTNAEFVPSERELKRFGFTIEDWVSNKPITYENSILTNETDTIQDMELFNPSTTEKQFDYLHAKSLVEIINKNYHHFH